MKKIISSIILTVLIFTMCITTASAENAVEKYEEILTGNWESLGYWGVPKDYKSNGFCYLEQFSYPYTSSCIITLVGNDDGEVYIFASQVANSSNFWISIQACGEVMFSADGNIMFIECGEYGHFAYVRK